MKIKRTNTFNLNPIKEQESRLFELSDNYSRMYYEINYKRRQSFFGGEIDWNTYELLKNTHRDAVGSVNIGLAQGESFTSTGVSNGVVTRHLLILVGTLYAVA